MFKTIETCEFVKTRVVDINISKQHNCKNQAPNSPQKHFFNIALINNGWTLSIEGFIGDKNRSNCTGLKNNKKM